MKDRGGGAEPHDAPAGYGTLPFPDIIEAARSAGVDWFVVEQDEPDDPLRDIEQCIQVPGWHRPLAGVRRRPEVDRGCTIEAPGTAAKGVRFRV